MPTDSAEAASEFYERVIDPDSPEGEAAVAEELLRLRPDCVSEEEAKRVSKDR